MQKEFNKRCVFLLDALRAIPHITCANTEGDFYLLPNISYYLGKKAPKGKLIENATDFSNFILEESNVAIITGIAFEVPKNVRVAFSNSLEKIELCVQRIAQALAKRH